MFEELRHRTRQEHRVGDSAYRKFLRDAIPSKRFAGFVAETTDGEVVAGACVWMREIQPHPGRISPKRGAYLMSVYTASNFRGRGLARTLVKQCMNWARKNGSVQMSLHASKMGRKMYKRLGFERTWEMRIDLK
jgi:ribosomal protein S18 acetylase RimI-like enzyme